ncbi:conserved hypothetical protein [Gloeothece citriformis PCC 7424]|uniref:Phosphoribosyltransferase n=1 Tax=Gloeothece citriformis (strain PCC 7424) TaxID=65393 RepID=B7KJ43_GLOC7|nr:ComF family protein [Gloeothece citriformis]ACK72127.1 conserved hypothetical protein [Gloeothece citriformis PCC 7424]
MLKSLLSLFLKPNCSLCDRSADDILCKDCQRQIKSCQFKNPRQFWQGEHPLFAWGEYGGQLKRAIATLKYDKHPELGTYLGQWIGETWIKLPPSFSPKKISVVPIPIHAEKLKQRGFNQADLIAEGFSHMTGYPLIKNGLERIKKTEAMFGLNPTEREKNIKNAFKIGQGLQKPSSLPVLLLDDIYTSGQTVKEAAKTLRSHGVQVLGVVALSTPKLVN